MLLTSDCGQVYIVIESCHLGCACVLVFVFDYCHRIAVNTMEIIGVDKESTSHI